jgi:hypothetical protein
MSNTVMSSVRRAVLTLVLLVAGACDGEAPATTTPDAGTARPADLCGGMCTEVELCVADKEGKYGCARICANQLRCWSGCCLPLEDSSGYPGYNVCRPSNWCYVE